MESGGGDLVINLIFDDCILIMDVLVYVFFKNFEFFWQFFVCCDFFGENIVFLIVVLEWKVLLYFVFISNCFEVLDDVV